jgi:MFS family permease
MKWPGALRWPGYGPGEPPSAAAEAMYRREAWPWALLGLTLGLVEGATAAVLVKTGYAGAADPFAVNLATAFVSGAPAFSNVVSFAWANIAHGRSRVPIIVTLQAAFAILVGLIGLAPRATAGLAFTVLAILAARVLWAGILTIRAATWTANYPRSALGRITGRIVVLSSLTLALAAALAGSVLQSRAFDPRWLYGGAAAVGLLAAWLYRRTRVRREFARLAEEQAESTTTEPFSLAMLREILAADPGFRGYMFWMSLYGGGSLMLTSQLVVIFTDVLALPSGLQIALLSVVPLATLPLFVPWWARLFDSSHVIVYRARQGWSQLAAMACFAAGVVLSSMPLLWVGAVLLGAAYAGANLGWNLGHNDFATRGRAQHYMGVHVTLTGLRGMIAPPLGIVAYEVLERASPGFGPVSLAAPLLMTGAGVIGFNRMRRDFADAASRPTGVHRT